MRKQVDLSPDMARQLEAAQKLVEKLIGCRPSLPAVVEGILNAGFPIWLGRFTSRSKEQKP